MNKRKLLLLGAIVAAIVVFFASGAQDYFTLQSLKASQSEFQALFEESPFKVAGTFFVVYVAMAALSLPGGHCSPCWAAPCSGLAGVCC